MRKSVVGVVVSGVDRIMTINIITSCILKTCTCICVNENEIIAVNFIYLIDDHHAWWLGGRWATETVVFRSPHCPPYAEQPGSHLTSRRV